MQDHLPPGPAVDDSGDLPTDREKPPLRADIAVLASRGWCKRIRAAVPDEITVDSFTDPGAFEDALNGNLAVALLTRELPASRLKTTVRRVVASSPHARIALLGERESDDEAVPRDAEFVPPIDRGAFVDRVKQLYVRAHYAATLDRYYSVSVTLRNAELSAPETVDDGNLDRLRTVRDRSRQYLRQFRAYLDEDDIDALKSRSDRLEALVAETRATPDPNARGLPESCPDCGLDWTTWHSRGLEHGFQKLSANTWQCKNCGETIADASPSDYQVS
jgi:hypothetical protein